jgi:putative transcriptional regulator
VNNKLFGERVESMMQMGQIVGGERKPSREFHVNSQMVKKLRAASGLSELKVVMPIQGRLARRLT